MRIATRFAIPDWNPMPSKSTATPKVTSTGYHYTDYKNQIWDRNARNEPLKAHPVSILVTRTDYKVTRNFADPTNIYKAVRGPQRGHSNMRYTVLGGRMRIAAANRAYAALKKEVEAGNAGLGVTIASYQQSADMIRTRADQISAYARKCQSDAKAINATRKKRRRQNLAAKRKKLPPKWEPADLIPVGSANLFLEGLFGWGPLYSSVKDAFKILGSDAPSERISRSRSVSEILKKPTSGFSPGFTQFDALYTVRVNQAATFRLINPNTHLLNQMGLINPLVVAWDLVPWSFVVNMFFNVNALLSSVSDFIGLEVTNASTTLRDDYYEVSLHDSQLWGGHPYYVTERLVINDYAKDRILGLTQPSLQFTVPKLSLTSALMATSLLVQQISGLKYLKNSGRLTA